MPRRGGVPKRDVLPDPIYNSKVITKLINQVMYDGKKGIAQRIVYDAFDIIKEKTGRDAMEVFNQAMENIMPMVETKARRVGGSNYQVPIEVRPERRQTLGLRWLVTFTRKRSERTMKERLAAEAKAAEEKKAEEERQAELQRQAEEQAAREAAQRAAEEAEQEAARQAAHRALVIRLTCVGAFSALVIALAVVLIRKLHKAGRC